MGQEIISSEIKEKIENGSDMETVIISKNEVKKYLSAAEVNIEGRIYDIVTWGTEEDNINFQFFNFEGELEDKNFNQFVNFLYLESNLIIENSLVKTKIHLASINDASLKISSLCISPETLPPRENLFI